jgi:hypothetical protein
MTGSIAPSYGSKKIVPVPLMRDDLYYTATLAGGDTALNGDLKARTKVFNVDDATGITAANTIIIGYGTRHAEIATVASVNGNEITLSANVAWDHADNELVKEYTAVTMDGSEMLYTDPRNLILGIQRDIRIEPDRRPRLRATDFVITMRLDTQVENADAAVLAQNLKVR